MPNHVVTHLFIEGTTVQVEQVKAFVHSDTDKDRLMDFHKIVPCPQSYFDYDTTNHPDGKGLEIGKHLHWGENSPVVTEELIEEYKKATKEQAELYGVVGWYDWNMKNWGTKWNAYDFEYLGGNGIKFETAWSFPKPVIVALSKHFPDITFSFMYADEDASFNTGEGELLNGEFLDQYYPKGKSMGGWRLYTLTHPDSIYER